MDWRDPTLQEREKLSKQLKPLHKLYVACEVGCFVLAIVTFLRSELGYSLTFGVFFFLTIGSHIKDTVTNKASSKSYQVLPCTVDTFCPWVYFGNGASSLPRVKVRLSDGQIYNRSFVVPHVVYYAARGGIRVPCLLVRIGSQIRLYSMADFTPPVYNPVNPVKSFTSWETADDHAKQHIIDYLEHQTPSKAKLGVIYKWLGLGLGILMAFSFVVSLLETLPNGYITFDIVSLMLSVIGFTAYFVLKSKRFDYKGMIKRIKKSGCDYMQVVINTVYIKNTQCCARVSDMRGNDLEKPVKVFPDVYSAYIASGKFHAILCRSRREVFVVLFKYQ